MSSIPSTDPAVEVRGARRHYGALRAVDGVDMCIERGEIFGLIGHNGAGKSTLFKLMLGLLAPTAGEIRVDGEPVCGRGFRAVRRRIGYLPEQLALYDTLSGIETLRFFARLKGVPSERCATMLARVGLDHAAARPVREYSKGMRQRLGFAQALLGEPRVLFLDEPTNGLDPQAIRDFHALLRTLRDDGVTIVISSHILAELQTRVDRLAIMSSGRVHALGSVQALRQQARMPIAIALRLAADDLAAAQALLASLPQVDAEPSADGLRVTCSSEAKVAVLGALAPLGTRLRDIDIHEPTLEDLFFGVAG